MTQIGSVYGEAIYQLAREEHISEDLLQQLRALEEAFSCESDFVKLLSSPTLTKEERLGIVESSFRGKIHDYLLNFMKILTEKGYMRHFSDCVGHFTELYNRDHGILPVTAVTAVSMTDTQKQKLAQKLGAITGKQVQLHNRIDPEVLGGMRLDYDGKRVDDTVAHRLDSIRALLKNTVL